MTAYYLTEGTRNALRAMPSTERISFLFGSSIGGNDALYLAHLDRELDRIHARGNEALAELEEGD